MRRTASGSRATPFPLLAALLLPPGAAKADEPIRIGVLHSLTGTMAESERPLVDALFGCWTSARREAVEEVDLERFALLAPAGRGG